MGIQTEFDEDFLSFAEIIIKEDEELRSKQEKEMQDSFDKLIQHIINNVFDDNIYFKFHKILI